MPDEPESLEPGRRISPRWISIERSFGIGIVLTAVMLVSALTLISFLSPEEISPQVSATSPATEVGKAGVAVTLGLLAIGILSLITERRQLDPARWWRQEAAPPPPWGLWDCLKTVSFLLVVPLLLMPFLVSCGDLAARLIGHFAIMVMTLVYALAILAVKGVSRAELGLTTAGVGRQTTVALRAYLACLPPMFFLLWLCVTIAMLVRSAGGMPPVIERQKELEYFLNPALTPSLLVVYALFIVTIGPLAEEVLFRGLFYGALRHYLPWQGAAIVSGIVFGLVHGDAVRFVPLAALGVFLAVLRERTSGLLVPILVHCLFNGGNLLQLFIQRL